MLVEEKRWMTAEEFNAQLGLCQFLPGPNVINLAVVVGKRYQGALGAIVQSVEQTYFGGRPAGREDYLGCRQEFETLRRSLAAGTA